MSRVRVLVFKKLRPSGHHDIISLSLIVSVPHRDDGICVSIVYLESHRAKPLTGLNWRAPKGRPTRPPPAQSPTQLLFITAEPNTKLCVWGEKDSGVKTCAMR
jgi:hypothetical protein